MKNLNLILLFFVAGALASCSSEKTPAPTEKASSSESATTTPPSEQKEPEKPNPPGTQSIKGQASVTLKGQSWAQPLNKLQIVLMPIAAIPAIKKIREVQWLERASRSNFGDGYNNLDLVAMGLEAKRQSLLTAPVESDAQGYFIIPAVKPGTYSIYAQYKSRYAIAYWLLKVEVKEGVDTKLDLNNENMTEIFNRFRAQ